MRPISPGLKARIASRTTSWAWLVRITRRDGVVMGFTSLDTALTVDGTQYLASSAFSPSAVEMRSDMAADNLQLDGMLGFLSDDTITEDDLGAGVYDEARLDIFVVDWRFPELGTLHRFRGFFGDVNCRGGKYSVDVRSLAQTLATTKGRTITPQCDATLGDRRCKVDLAAHTITGTVLSTDGARGVQSLALAGKAADWWAKGLVTWTSGRNKGSRSEVGSSSGTGFVLRERPARPVAAGDTFRLHPGCDLEHSTCILKWGNGKNFRGFPSVPGLDAILRYPDVPVS